MGSHQRPLVAHDFDAAFGHLGFGPDDPANGLAEQADGFFEAGVDVVVWSMRGPTDPARLAPFAEALASH